MAEETKFRYYVVYEIWGYWNAYTEFMRLSRELDTEEGIREATKELESKHGNRSGEVRITNWKRIQ